MERSAKNVATTASSHLTKDEVLDKLTTILAEVLVLNKEDINVSDKLVEDLDADSIAFLELTYRLGTDFGLEVPDVKADEETLRMPLLDGLERLEKTIGSTTLFEFMRDEAMRQSSGDAEMHGAVNQMLLEKLKDESFMGNLKAAFEDAGTDVSARRAVGNLVLELRRTPELAVAFDEALRKNTELAAALTEIEGAVKAELVDGRDDGSTDLFTAWRDVMGSAKARTRMTEIQVKQLAQLMGTDVPAGYKPDAAVTSLQLRDLFGFITVDSYVRYIMYMAGSQHHIKQFSGPEPTT